MNSSLKQRVRFYAIRPFHHWLAAFGIDPLKFYYSARSLPTVLGHYFTIRGQNARLDSPWPLHFASPCLGEDRAGSGQAAGHYFHQDLLVARKIYERNPSKHVDIGSRVDGFVAHVAVFRDVEVLDIRPQSSLVRNIRFVQADMMKKASEYADYCDSLSCLHALEHFGLGRYGDQIDIEGYQAGIHAMHHMLCAGGILYLSVPIGIQRIDFNSQRIFAITTILAMTSRLFELCSFSYVDDKGDLIEDAILTPEGIEDSLGLWYGCGIFEFQKLPLGEANHAAAKN